MDLLRGKNRCRTGGGRNGVGEERRGGGTEGGRNGGGEERGGGGTGGGEELPLREVASMGDTCLS